MTVRNELRQETLNLICPCEYWCHDTQVLITHRSSPVYPKQEVVLEEPIPEWGCMIPEELGSRYLCLDNQICFMLDRAYPHIIKRLAIFWQKRLIACVWTRISGKWDTPWWNWRAGRSVTYMCRYHELDLQSRMISTYVLQQCIAYSNHTVNPAQTNVSNSSELFGTIYVKILFRKLTYSLYLTFI